LTFSALTSSRNEGEITMAFELPPLPYSRDALAPHMSRETLEYHYGKHHQDYVKKLNKLVAGTGFERKSLEAIIKDSRGKLFNNASQVWNHSFFWHCLSPHGGGEPTAIIADAISGSYDSLDHFRQQFNKSALANFGSGWTWLVKDDDSALRIVNTSNAKSPLTDESVTPLLALDVWEHAYYIDYRNSRPKYLGAFWNLVNWEFVENNFR
jgi:Fe-Mn family superoxide dismutase